MSRNTSLYIFINNSIAIDSFHAIHKIYVQSYDALTTFFCPQLFSENSVFFMRFNTSYIR